MKKLIIIGIFVFLIGVLLANALDGEFSSPYYDSLVVQKFVEPEPYNGVANVYVKLLGDSSREYDVFDYLSIDVENLQPLKTIKNELYWYYWIDYHPDSRFVHPIKHVFIRISDGSIESFDGKSWPFILEYQPKIGVSEVQITEQDKIYDWVEDGLLSEIKSSSNQLTGGLIGITGKANGEDDEGQELFPGEIITEIFEEGELELTFSKEEPKKDAYRKDCWKEQESKKYIITITGNLGSAPEKFKELQKQNIEKVKSFFNDKWKDIPEGDIKIEDMNSEGSDKIDKRMNDFAEQTALKCNDEVIIYLDMEGEIYNGKWRGIINPQGLKEAIEKYREFQKQGKEDTPEGKAAFSEMASFTRNKYLTQFDLNDFIADIAWDSENDRQRVCNIYVFVNACYSGGLLTIDFKTNNIKGVQIVFTSAPDDSVSKDDKISGSFFTDALFNRLNKDLKEISQKELEKAVIDIFKENGLIIFREKIEETLKDFDKLSEEEQQRIIEGVVELNLEKLKALKELNPQIGEGKPCLCRCCGENLLFDGIITNAYTLDSPEGEQCETTFEDKCPQGTSCDTENCVCVGPEGPMIITPTPVFPVPQEVKKEVVSYQGYDFFAYYGTDGFYVEVFKEEPSAIGLLLNRINDMLIFNPFGYSIWLTQPKCPTGTVGFAEAETGKTFANADLRDCEAFVPYSEAGAFTGSVIFYISDTEVSEESVKASYEYELNAESGGTTGTELPY